MTREEKLQKALDLALCLLIKHEIPDSRAVSNEFVAMSSVACGLEDSAGECIRIIESALESEKRDGYLESQTGD